MSAIREILIYSAIANNSQMMNFFCDEKQSFVAPLCASF